MSEDKTEPIYRNPAEDGEDTDFIVRPGRLEARWPEEQPLLGAVLFTAAPGGRISRFVNSVPNEVLAVWLLADATELAERNPEGFLMALAEEEPVAAATVLKEVVKNQAVTEAGTVYQETPDTTTFAEVEIEPISGLRIERPSA